MPICRLLSVSFFGHLDGRSAQSPLGMQQHYEAARPKCYSTLGPLGARRTGQGRSRPDDLVLAMSSQQSAGNCEAFISVLTALGCCGRTRMASARRYRPLVGDMTFFWILSSGYVLSAGLLGYGLGYLNGVRDTIIDEDASGKLRFRRVVRSASAGEGAKGGVNEA